MTKPTAALILAAGQGKRMRSQLPKVLHRCGELPLVAHVVRLALGAGCSPVVVVVDPQGDAIRVALAELFPGAPLSFAVQERPLGTGDAARAGMSALTSFSGQVLILYGDVPLLTPGTVARLKEQRGSAALAMLTGKVDDPTGYGRVVREGGKVSRIVEHKDATPAERSINEVNVGVYDIEAGLLRDGLGSLSRNNAQGELYLTDVVALAAKRGEVATLTLDDMGEVRGVNTRAELHAAEEALRRRLIAQHQERGVSFRDVAGTFLGVDVEIEPDAEIGVGVQLWGKTKVGAGARLDGPTVVRDSVIGGRAVVEAFCHLEGASVAPGAHVGPFARLRPGAVLEEGARVGNFVEVKKSRLGKGAKANHLAYIGDAEVGPGANVGAGTITCNYDGVSKHPTHIGAGAFIGSNSTLVAPVRVGDGAYVAAGSTITKEVPKDALAFGRARQETREGMAVRLRERIQKAKKTKEHD